MPPKIYYPQRWYRWPEVDLLTLLFDTPHALAQDDKPLHVDATAPSNLLTKLQLRILTEQLAHSFRTHYGIGVNGPNKDVVIGFSSLQHLLPAAFFGIIAAGGVYSAASHAYTAQELARQIRQGGSSLVVCSDDIKSVAIEAAKEAGLPLRNVLVLKSDEGKWSCRSVEGDVECIQEKRLSWEKITEPEKLRDSLIILLYSSGTTGAPKGVMLSHQMCVAQTFIPSQVGREWALPRILTGELTPSPQRTLAHLPAAHIAGVLGYFINPMYSGSAVYWMKGKYNWKDFLRFNKEHKITGWFTVPAILVRIGKSPDVTDHFATLEGALGGAAPMDAHTQHAAGAKFGAGKTQVGGTWGMSETVGSVTSLPRGMTDNTGSVGVMHPNCLFRLVDDDDNDVPEGQPGEAIVKSPTVTKGYFNAPEATEEAFLDGWYRTGDIVQERNGLWYVTDRKKELIKYKGLQVAPAELEGLLQSHPLIEDAAVIGVPYEDTEAPRAYIVADKAKISEQEVRKLIEDTLAPYKQLRGGVVYLDEIPRSSVGKILRRELRDLAKKDIRPKL